MIVRTQIRWVIAALVSLTVLLATLGFSVLAWRVEPELTSTGATTASEPVRPPGAQLESDVRTFPLHSDPGPLAGGVTPSTVAEALSTTAAQLGIVSDVGVLARSTLESFSGNSDYPYAYPELDSVIAAELDAGAVARNPELVLDFVAVAETAAAHAMARSGFDDLRGVGAVAYSVLRQALLIAPSCDLQLQQLHLVTLGNDAQDASVTAELTKAQQLCPDDPTPLWLRAQDRARRAYASYVLSDLTPAQLLEGAIKDLQALQRAFPQSPLGYAGEADLLLDRADENEAQGMRPFQVRKWRRSALDLGVKARSLSDDLGLLVGHARALSDLGRHQEAQAVLAQLTGSSSRLASVVTQQVRTHQAAGDSRGVLDLLSGAVAFPDGTQISNSSSRLPGFGRLDSLNTIIWDASYRPSGGADTEDVAFIPQSRGDHKSDGRCLEQAGRNALLLLGRTEEAPRWDPPKFTSPLNDRGESPCVDQLNAPTTSEDGAQDLFRWAGDLAGAQKVVDAWTASRPLSYQSHQRAGEVAYLRGDWAAAEAAFSRALEV